MPINILNIELLEEALKSIGGFVIINREQEIVYLNEEYANSIGIEMEKSIGKKVTDIIPNSRMPVVLKTGKEDIASFFTLSTGQTVLVNRLPIIKQDEVIGVIGVTTFAHIDKMGNLNKKIIELNNEAKYYRSELEALRGAKYSIDQIISSDPNMKRIKELVRKASQTRSTVLIVGESGTGKELFAHAIHQLSPRKHFPFIRINCAAIPENLIEAELFGYEDGAFTGAKKGGSQGKFEIANGGTFLLDEINSLPLNLQSKLLRVIQEKEIQKIGGSDAKEIDVRLIFTTNENLLEMVKQGTFREDLYYRINVVEFNIPPLRDRKGDIPELIEYLIPKLNAELGLNIIGIGEGVLELFMNYDWPGNVRELENCLERGFNNAISGRLEIQHVEFLYQRLGNESIGDNDQFTSLQKSREIAERKAIIQTLMLSKGNKKLAAEMLDIDRSILYDKIKKYKIVDPAGEIK